MALGPLVGSISWDTEKQRLRLMLWVLWSILGGWLTHLKSWSGRFSCDQHGFSMFFPQILCSQTKIFFGTRLIMSDHFVWTCWTQRRLRNARVTTLQASSQLWHCCSLEILAMRGCEGWRICLVVATQITNMFGIFTPKIGEDEPILTDIFQTGWNHQPDLFGEIIQVGLWLDRNYSRGYWINIGSIYWCVSTRLWLDCDWIIWVLGSQLPPRSLHF